jgi:hypothetical protein
LCHFHCSPVRDGLLTPVHLLCLLQWFLEHDSSGSERQKAFSPNLLAATAPDVLVAYLQWLDSGMPGYVGRSSTDKLVGSSSPALACGMRQSSQQSTCCQCAQHASCNSPIR